MPGTPKGVRYGGRKPHTPNKVTQSICILLNTILPPEELEHDDVQHVYANFDIDESEIQAAVSAN